MPELLIVKNIEREGAGLFEKIALQKGMNIRVIEPYRGDKLPKLKKDNFLLIMGGPMGLRDVGNPNLNWLNDEIDLIKYSLDQEIPLIGICLGAQLLAYSAGGNIKKLYRGNPAKIIPEIGWGQIDFNFSGENQKFKSYFPNHLQVLHWHGDRIILPNSGNLIASSKICNEQFFNIGKYAFGIQFHVEVEGNMLNKWIEEDKEFINLGLGSNGSKIVQKQQEIHEKETEKSRLLFIEKLFEILEIGL